MIKKTFYFSHDYNARNDEKIIRLISKEGWQGYGIYWAIIEKLYEADGYLNEDYTCIAFDLRTECDRITTVIQDYNLFEVANKKISSKSVLARLRRTLGISEKNRQNAKKRWDKPKKDNATAMRPHTSGNAIRRDKMRRDKMRRDNNNTSKACEKKQQSNGNQMATTKIENLEHKQIVEIFDLFKKINPMINFGHKTNRQAIQDMIKKFGFDKILATVKYSNSIQGKKYAPTITTPYHLKNKLGELRIYFEKNNNKTIIC